MSDPSIEIPLAAKFVTIDGDAFVSVRDAAKVAKLHPVAFSMAGELLKGIGSRGCAFLLETPELQANGTAIEKRLVKDLRKSVKKLEPGRKIKAKSRRAEDRIVFWLSA